MNESCLIFFSPVVINNGNNANNEKEKKSELHLSTSINGPKENSTIDFIYNMYATVIYTAILL